MASLPTRTITRTEELLKQADGDAKRALELAISESERLRQDSQVKIGQHGIEDANYASLWRMAQMYASSAMVPDHFKGKPSDCFVACELSIRLKCNVFMLMQSMYIVHGKPGMEAKMQIALANNSGKFKGPIRWREPTGTIKDGTRRWVAYAIDRETGEEIEQELSWSEVVAEGWNKKAGSKWLTIPELMAKYRTASWLIRTYCPEVVMGLPTIDEIRDHADRPEDTEIQQVDLDAIERMLEAAPQQAAKDDAPARADQDDARKEFAECIWKMTEASSQIEANKLLDRCKELAIDDGMTEEAVTVHAQQIARIKGSRGEKANRKDPPATLLPETGEPPADVLAAMEAEGIS